MRWVPAARPHRTGGGPWRVRGGVASDLVRLRRHTANRKRTRNRGPDVSRNITVTCQHLESDDDPTHAETLCSDEQNSTETTGSSCKCGSECTRCGEHRIGHQRRPAEAVSGREEERPRRREDQPQ
eukprot:5276595-Prymnesium_polylepis.1